MDSAALLEMLKLNLTIANTTYDSYLEQLIEAAQSMISREGITLSLDGIEDCNLVVMYAAYLFRERAEDNPVMPRMLRYALNNRLFSEKVGEDS